MTDIERHDAELGGIPVSWLSAGDSATLYVHGVPDHAQVWTPFLELGGGIAVDLPGFGHSGKPAGFDYSIAGYDRWLESFCDLAGLDRFKLVVHDWGGAALAFAGRRRERIERVVVIDAVPLLPGYRWHRLARAWRTPFVGEFTMGVTTDWGLRRAGLDREHVAQILSCFDHGTQRAILKLYRSAPANSLAAAGLELRSLNVPALIVWGERDPYIAVSFAADYAATLGGEVVTVDGGHWPWLDDPSLIERIAGF